MMKFSELMEVTNVGQVVLFRNASEDGDFRWFVASAGILRAGIDSWSNLEVMDVEAHADGLHMWLG